MQVIDLNFLTWGSWDVVVNKGVAKILPLFPIHVLVASFSKKPVQLLQQMVTQLGAGFSSLREQASGPFEPGNEECDVNKIYISSDAIYISSESKESQMRTYENVMGKHEEQLKED